MRSQKFFWKGNRKNITQTQSSFKKSSGKLKKVFWKIKFCGDHHISSQKLFWKGNRMNYNWCPKKSSGKLIFHWDINLARNESFAGDIFFKSKFCFRHGVVVWSHICLHPVAGTDFTLTKYITNETYILRGVFISVLQYKKNGNHSMLSF